ncbi:MAG: GDSL-type esterase/lipase family protein [Deltaproteobacteria bacterium]
MTSAAPAPPAMQDAPRGDTPSVPGSSVADDSAEEGASPPDPNAGGEKDLDGGEGPDAAAVGDPASPGGSEPEPPADDVGVDEAEPPVVDTSDGEASEPPGDDASGAAGEGSSPDGGSQTPGSEAPGGESPGPGSEPPQDDTPAEPPGAEPPQDETPAEPPGAEPPADDGPGAEPPADDGVAPGSSTGAALVGPGSPEIPSGRGSFHLSIIGSSTAAGIGASRGDLAWASLLDAALTAKVTTTFSSSNLAQGGYTAIDLLPGSTSSGSIDDAIAEKPDLIVVALAGSNDLGPGVTTETFIAALITLRETARAAGIPTFFMGTLPKNFSQPDRETLVEWDRAMASEFSVCWIPGPTQPYAPCYMDVFAALADASLGLAPALDSGDGQHPNDAGHALLFAGVAPIVSLYVCSKTTCR